MHMISGFAHHAAAGSAPNVGANLTTGASFQLAALTNPQNQPVARGAAPAAGAALGTQTVSTLLQTQDLSQTQPHGGHGGGHHGGMKIISDIQAEETEETEQAQHAGSRRKPAKIMQPEIIKETAESDETTPPAEDAAAEKTADETVS